MRGKLYHRRKWEGHWTGGDSAILWFKKGNRGTDRGMQQGEKFTRGEGSL